MKNRRQRIYSAVQRASNVVAFDFAGRARPILNAVIIYENIAAGKRAKEVCDMVSERFGASLKIAIEMSSFKSLHVPQMREVATSAVAGAHLVIFSCRHRDLPSAVWKWIQLWPLRLLRPAALVALLAGDPAQAQKPPGVEQILAEAARQRGMDYFAHRCVLPAENAAEPLMSIVGKEPDDECSCATERRNRG